MRTISAASLAKLQQKTGTEPITVIEIDWYTLPTKPSAVGNRRLYGDRKFPEHKIEGRILNMNDIEDVLNISKSGVSQQVSLVLDDADGELKNIFNSVDIHKKRVWIYQWFTGIPLTDKFLMFAGVIASPITWSEAERVLGFSVISKAEDREVGFSPEEGQFPFLPPAMVGQAWPLIFGTVAKLPTIRVDAITYRQGDDDPNTGSYSDSYTDEGTGIEDPAIQPHLDDMNRNATNAKALAVLYFIGYLQASGAARRAGELDDLADIDEGSGPFSSLAKQYLDLGNKFLLESQQIGQDNDELGSVQSAQRENEKDSIKVVNGDLLPQNTEVKVALGGALHKGRFNGDSFQITERTHPRIERFSNLGGLGTLTNEQAITTPNFVRDEFAWADAGQPLLLNVYAQDPDNEQPSNHLMPVRYIVAGSIRVSVLAVYAYRTVNQRRRMIGVPATYYQVIQTAFGTLPVTMLYLPQPLSSLADQNGESLGWDDEIWVTVRSPIGPNVVDIMTWLIQHYTDHEIDTASFNSVRTLVNPYPAHFALTDRPQVMSLLASIAYQSRCMVWLKNNKYFIRYLPKKETPVTTITQADILEQTFELTCTETEDIVTKYIAEWQADYKTGLKNLCILRFNIDWYGTIEKRVFYYIYNMQQLVEKSATFWMVREANTFKRVKFKLPIKFLNIESLDTITLNFGSKKFIANGPIDCLVEEAVVNTEDYTISLQVWVPVRTGEMTEYSFVFPYNHPDPIDDRRRFPPRFDIEMGRVGNIAAPALSLNKDVRPPAPDPTNPNLDRPFSGSEGNGGYFHVTDRPHTWGVDEKYFTDNGNLTPEIITRLDTAQLAALGKKPDGTTLYQLKKTKVVDQPFTTPSSAAIPGKVVSGSGRGPYTVDAYLKGRNNEPTPLKDVYVIDMHESDSVPEGSGVTIIQTVYKDNGGAIQIEYSMQPNVWK